MPKLGTTLLTIDDVIALWHCHRVTVLRLMKRGLLHPIQVGGEPCFQRAEVMKLKNRRIAIHPHLTVAR